MFIEAQASQIISLIQDSKFLEVFQLIIIVIDQHLQVTFFKHV